MNNFKLLRKLPTLFKNQEWACDAGCDLIKPRLHENIYAREWDIKTKELKSQHSEYYYTCMHGHALGIWSNLLGNYVEAEARFYEEVIFPNDVPLEVLECFISEMQLYAENFKLPDSLKNAALECNISISCFVPLNSDESIEVHIEDLKAMRDRILLPKKIEAMDDFC